MNVGVNIGSGTTKANYDPLIEIFKSSTKLELINTNKRTALPLHTINATIDYGSNRD